MPTMEERIRLFEEYERNKTPEDVLADEREEEEDERYIAENPVALEDCRPIEELWKAWGLEDRVPGQSNPRNRKTA